MGVVFNADVKPDLNGQYIYIFFYFMVYFDQHSSAVVTVALKQQEEGFIPAPVALHILPVSAWVLTRYSGFLLFFFTKIHRGFFTSAVKDTFNHLL